VDQAELFSRFDHFVAAVKRRLAQTGEDTGILDVRRSEFILRAVTLKRDPRRYYAADVREVLETSTPDELADTFIDKWRTQRRIDESPGSHPRGESPETFGRA
jgi:hypothetical protein